MVICRRKEEAEQSKQIIGGILKRLKLSLHPDKTRVVAMKEEGFDFLGFHFRKKPSKRTGRLAPYAWPGTKAMRTVRAKVREQTERRRLRPFAEARGYLTDEDVFRDIS